MNEINEPPITDLVSPLRRSRYRRYRCPVCWQNVMPTHQLHISLHFDSVGWDICPASNEPFDIAQPYVPMKVYVLRDGSGHRRQSRTRVAA